MGRSPTTTTIWIGDRMREITELHPTVIRDLDTAHIIHGEIMNEIVEVQAQMEKPLSKEHMPYLNGKLEVLLATYGLLNDIMWEKEKASR